MREAISIDFQLL